MLSSPPSQFSLLTGDAAMLGIFLVLVTVWFIALVAALTNDRLDPVTKLMWVLVVMLANILGALLYFVLAPSRVGRTERDMAHLHRRVLERR
jgi:formate/nitrite transporter FocA (FNT family)